MRFIKSLVVASFLPWGKANNDDIVLPPVQTDASLPERLLVFIPGAEVPTDNYKLTGQAIQEAATGLRLHVVIPSVFAELCIGYCPSESACGSLVSRVAAAVAKSTFSGTNPQEDTFVAGHSLGATCANFMVTYQQFQYAGLMEFGGYVDMNGTSSLPNYGVPLLHMAGELDGGAARPGKLAYFYGQSKTWGETHGETARLTSKAVHVLPGLDHSDFCPGFFVTAVKDLHSEVTQDVAMATIGRGASAFLHLNAPTDSATQSAAMSTMEQMQEFTATMLDPILEGFELEQGPWCEVAQHAIAGLSSADAGLLKVTTDVVPNSEFEHGRTHYTLEADGTLSVSVTSAAEAATSHQAARSVNCKMVDATRVAEQLGVTTDTTVTCEDVNKQAVAKALQLVSDKSRTRYEQEGRGWCYEPDGIVVGNIGPLFCSGTITLTETSDCWEVTSLSLVATTSSLIFPGNHYCKLLSPAMAMEWIMTDSLKPYPWHEMSARVVV